MKGFGGGTGEGTLEDDKLLKTIHVFTPDYGECFMAENMGQKFSNCTV